MPRSFTYQALALRVKPSGESNREAWFLSSEEGIIRATVFGGPKSRLRSHVAPFHEGKLMIYHDPVKDSSKVSDFDVQSWRPGIREVWERAMAADAVAETILVSQGGGGNWSGAVKFSSAVLDALNEASAGACRGLAVYFLWYWAQILGVRPDLSVCATCGGEGRSCSGTCEAEREGVLSTGPQGEVSRVLWYSARKEALFCEKCVRNYTDREPLLRLGPGGLNWLREIEALPPSAIAEQNLDKSSLEQAKALSEAVLTRVFGKRLNTWDEI